MSKGVDNEEIRLNSESEFPSQRPLRVAVIGGGCAALTAAFELTRPQHLGRYQVTVYQMGWRLGGKGASGRNPAGRIEEHGLHLWMGFYENAFLFRTSAPISSVPGKGLPTEHESSIRENRKEGNIQTKGVV